MKILWAFARQNFQVYSIYRLDFLLRSSSLLILMFGIRWVWITLYTQRPEAFGVTLQQMVTYGVLSIAIQNLFFTGPQYYIARQVRSGAIDSDLLKPLDFHFHMLARSAGEMLLRIVVIAIPGVLVGYFLFDLQFPTNSKAGFMFVVALLLGFLVNFHLDFLLGAISVVTLEINSIDWAFHATSRFFSGQFLPLWLFPGVLGTLAEILPFRSVFFIPLSIYNGTLSGDALREAIAFQLLWLIILLMISRWVWERVQGRLVSQGG